MGATLGGCAVLVFFALSGFLIYKSYERNQLAEFVEARVLRIYPALCVVVLLSVFIIGPAFTILPLEQYATSRETIEYIPRALSLKFVSFSLPGVFAGTPFPAVNGPLWTLWYEIACYMGLAVSLTLLKRFEPCLVLYAIAYLFLRETLYGPLSLAFVTGMAIYRYRITIPAGPLVAVGLLAASFAVRELMPIFIGYTSLWVAQMKSPLLAYNKTGDYSYGLYIYGWPVQEIVVSLVPHISPLGVMCLSLPAALVCAIISWHFIEQPCLRAKGVLVKNSFARSFVSRAAARESSD